MRRLSKTQICIILITLLAIFFLSSVTAGVGLYTKASRMSEKAALLTGAISEISSIAETLKASDGSLKRTAKLMRTSDSYTSGKNSMAFYYDGSLKETSESAAVYTAVTSKENSAGCYLYTITLCRIEDGEQIHQLAFKDIKNKEK